MIAFIKRIFEKFLYEISFLALFFGSTVIGWFLPRRTLIQYIPEQQEVLNWELISFSFCAFFFGAFLIFKFFGSSQGLVTAKAIKRAVILSVISFSAFLGNDNGNYLLDTTLIKVQRSGLANLNNFISGNSGPKAQPMMAGTGVFDGQEISAPYPAHPHRSVQSARSTRCIAGRQDNGAVMRTV